MNLPTKLTVSRIILSVVIIILLLFPFYAVGINFPEFKLWGVAVESQYLIAGVIFVIASLTDFFDGNYARSHNMVTDTGKMLDAIADKVLVNSALIILASQGYIPTVVAVVVILRDIVVNAIKMEAAAKGKVVAAIKSGKLKTATLMVGLTLAFFYNIPFALININASDFLLYVAAILSIVSGIQYFSLNKELIFPKTDSSKA